MEEQSNKKDRDRKQIADSRCKSYLISNYLICKWIKVSNQKSEDDILYKNISQQFNYKKRG